VRHVAATVVTSSDAATSEVAAASDGEADDDMAAAVTTATTSSFKGLYFELFGAGGGAPTRGQARRRPLHCDGGRMVAAVPGCWAVASAPHVTRGGVDVAARGGAPTRPLLGEGTATALTPDASGTTMPRVCARGGEAGVTLDAAC